MCKAESNIMCNFLVFLTFHFHLLLLITERERISQMQEHYERLLRKAKDELEVLREQVDMAQQKLIITQKWYVCC